MKPHQCLTLSPRAVDFLSALVLNSFALQAAGANANAGDVDRSGTISPVNSSDSDNEYVKKVRNMDRAGNLGGSLAEAAHIPEFLVESLSVLPGSVRHPWKAKSMFQAINCNDERNNIRNANRITYCKLGSVAPGPPPHAVRVSSDPVTKSPSSQPRLSKANLQRANSGDGAQVSATGAVNSSKKPDTVASRQKYPGILVCIIPSTFCLQYLNGIFEHECRCEDSFYRGTYGADVQSPILSVSGVIAAFHLLCCISPSCIIN